jgi:endonuclease YncB( thermonuclease family)
MNFQRFVNFLPIIAIVGLGWYSLSLQPKMSREMVLSVPESSGTLQIPNGEPDVAASFSEYEVIPGSIHDGDTLQVRSSKGKILKVRFACVDAPELKQPLGEESRNYLRSLVNRGGNKVKVQAITVDRYGRTVAQLWNNQGLIQSQMVIAGMAYGYDQYKKDCPNWEAIESTQAQAQEAKLGVWKLQGGGQRPWKYRSNP